MCSGSKITGVCLWVLYLLWLVSASVSGQDRISLPVSFLVPSEVSSASLDSPSGPDLMLTVDILAAKKAHPEMIPLFDRIGIAWEKDSQTYENQLQTARTDSEQSVQKSQEAEQKAQKAEARAVKAEEQLSEYVKTFGQIPKGIEKVEGFVTRFEDSLMVKLDTANDTAAQALTDRWIFGLIGVLGGVLADEAVRRFVESLKK